MTRTNSAGMQRKQKVRVQNPFVEAEREVEKAARFTFHEAWRLIIFVVGISVLALGAVFLVLPGLPGWLTIFVGLVLLGSEFAWARWLLKKVKREARAVEKAVVKEFL